MARNCIKVVVYGKEYASQTEVAKAFGINLSTLRRRINENGMSYEEALSKSVRERCVEVTDHRGQTFRTLKECAEYYGLNASTVKGRLDKGETIEEALRNNVRNRKPCTDHLGNKYDSVTKMCRSYNIPVEIYKRRIRELKWSVEKALTTPCFVTDHLQRAYATIGEMCKAWGINQKTYTCRLKRGWSQRRALETPSGDYKAPARTIAIRSMVAWQLEKGTGYMEMIFELCKTFGITVTDARERIQSFDLTELSEFKDSLNLKDA